MAMMGSMARGAGGTTAGLRTALAVTAVDNISGPLTAISNSVANKQKMMLSRVNANTKAYTKAQVKNFNTYISEMKASRKRMTSDMLNQYTTEHKGTLQRLRGAKILNASTAVSDGLMRGFVSTMKLSAGAAIGMGTAFLGLAKMIGPVSEKLAGMAAITQRSVSYIYGTLGVTLRSMMKQFPKSAGEMSEALRVLSQAGLDVNEVNTAAIPIMNLSVATMSDFASTSALVVRVIKAMRMEMDGVEHVTNVLTFAVNNSVSTIQTLADSLKFAMPVANQLGMTIEDLTAGMMILQNAGLEAGIAGRSLQRALQKLVNPSSKATAIMSKYGMEILDANGEIKDMVSLVQELEGIYDSSSDALEAMNENMDESITKFQTAADFAELFGIRGGRAMANLIGKSGEMKEFRTAMIDDVAKSSQQATTAMENINSQMSILKNSFMSTILTTQDFNNAFLRMADRLAPKMEKLGETFSALAVKFFDRFAESDFTDRLIGVFEKLMGLVDKFLPRIVELGEYFASLAETFMGLASAGDGFGAKLAIANKMTGASSIATQRLNNNMMINGQMIQANVGYYGHMHGIQNQVIQDYEKDIKTTDMAIATNKGMINSKKDTIQLNKDAGVQNAGHMRSLARLTRKEADLNNTRKDQIRLSNKAFIGREEAKKGLEDYTGAQMRMNRSMIGASAVMGSVQAGMQTLIGTTAMYAAGNKKIALGMAAIQGVMMGLALTQQLLAASWISADAAKTFGIGAVIAIPALLAGLTYAFGENQRNATAEMENARDSVSRVAIPALAEGGIVTKPTIALIGEAGPEMVTPLSDAGAPMSIHIDMSNSIITETSIQELENRLERTIAEKWGARL